MLVLVSTSPAITQGTDYINLGWIGAMCLTPLVLLIPGCRVWVPRIDIPAGLFAILVILFPLLFHPPSFRWTTQFYTVACCCWAMALVRLTPLARLSRRGFTSAIDCIVFAYLAVLLIQQLCVALGWPVFNSGMSYRNPWKLNSLMSEPSQTSWVLSVLVFYRGLVNRNAAKKKSPLLSPASARTLLVWIAYLYVSFGTSNASAYVWTPIALIPYLTRRNWAPIFGIAGCVVLMLIVLTPAAGNEQLRRVFRISSAIPTLEEDLIRKADSSISMRINPSLTGWDAIGFSGADDWFGHGTDADTRQLDPPSPGIAQGDAGIFHAWYNYGILAALVLWGLCISAVFRLRQPLTILMLILAFIESAHHNGQLFWIILTVALIATPIKKHDYSHIPFTTRSE